MTSVDFQILGDPHLGRRFRNGVPLHRIGDREKMVWEQFELSILDADTTYHITMGDLFDKFVVAPEVVLNAAAVYLNGAERNPETTYIIINGNHDVSRDLTKKSSFDLFQCIVAGSRNIRVFKAVPSVVGPYGFVPFHAFTNTADLVSKLPDGLTAVFGHWDIVDFGGPNVIPTRLLAEKGITKAYSGHDHVARELTRDGVDVIVTGSMQPYSHAEDPDETLYITLPLAELESRDVSNMNVRVLLGEGEGIPEGIDCLSIVGKRIGAPDEETIELDTEAFDAVDVERLLSEVLHPLVRDQLMEKYHDAQ